MRNISIENEDYNPNIDIDASIEMFLPGDYSDSYTESDEEAARFGESYLDEIEREEQTASSKNKNEFEGQLFSSYKQYIIEQRQFSVMTPEEEFAVATDMQSSDPKVAAAAREKLITSNLRLVLKIANSYIRRGCPLELVDLVQEGNEGLVIAADKFKPQLRYRFNTYATYWIVQRIKTYTSQKSGSIEIPLYIRQRYNKMQDYISFYYEKNKHYPTDAEIAEYLGIKEKNVMKLRNVPINPVSFETPTGNDNNSDDSSELGDIIVDESEEDVADTTFKREMAQQIDVALQDLTFEEQNVIRAIFGLDGEDPREIKDIAKSMMYTEERVRQLKQSAFRKLSKNSSIKTLYASIVGKA